MNVELRKITGANILPVFTLTIFNAYFESFPVSAPAVTSVCPPARSAVSSRKHHATKRVVLVDGQTTTIMKAVCIDHGGEIQMTLVVYVLSDHNI